MIPQNFKDILSSGEYAGIFQTIAMVLFILLFLGIVAYVFTRPKKFYTDQENAPLDDGDEDQNTIN